MKKYYQQATLNGMTVFGPFNRANVYINMWSGAVLDTDEPWVSVDYRAYSLKYSVLTGDFLGYRGGCQDLSELELKKKERDFKKWLKEKGPLGNTNQDRCMDKWNEFVEYYKDTED